MRLVALAVGAVVALAGCGGSKTVTVTNTVTHVRTVTVTKPATTTTTPHTATTACAASSLQGDFVGVPGSAGAGQITYRLTLTNTGPTPCYLSGIPQVQLLSTTGVALPTSPSVQPNQGTAAKISLAHGKAATSDARFSPDVPGTGDNQAPGSPCQPVATVLLVTAPGGGKLDAPIQNPTSVCEGGSMRFTNFAAAP
ncbi:MAG: DUF4232 domain-containing protein [Actinobacteria bacterium]|nr:DUF4232 domain-containing protein [Actinomycetota bacterium]